MAQKWRSLMLLVKVADARNLLINIFINYIIFKTASSYPSSRMLKFTAIVYPLILTYMSPVFKLIIPFLYSTGSLEIVTNRYKYFFFLYSIPNHSTVLGVMWFLITLLSTIALNCLSYHLTFKLKCLLIVPLRV